MPIPSVNRPPLAAWSVEAIRASRAGWRFITLVTNVPSPIVFVAPAALERIVHCSTTGTRLSPLPTTWSHDQTAR